MNKVFKEGMVHVERIPHWACIKRYTIEEKVEEEEPAVDSVS